MSKRKLKTRADIEAELDKAMFIRRELRESRGLIDADDYAMMLGYVSALKFMLGKVPSLLSSQQRYSDLNRFRKLKMIDDIEHNARIAELTAQDVAEMIRLLKS